MAELTDLFDAVDANKASRKTADLNDLNNNTMSFSDSPTSDGMQFAYEGDDRGFDKINYNFKQLSNKIKQNLNTYTTITADHTAVKHNVIFADTTSGEITVTLHTINHTVVDILDIKSKFSTNNLTIEPSGSDTIMGNSDLVLSTNDEHVSLIRVDGDWRKL